MAEYPPPTTAQVKILFVGTIPAFYRPDHEERAVAFDQWLAEHDEQVRREAVEALNAEWEYRAVEVDPATEDVYGSTALALTREAVELLAYQMDLVERNPDMKLVLRVQRRRAAGEWEKVD